MISKHIPDIIGIFLVPFLTVLLSIFIGQLIGRSRARQFPELKEGAVGSVVGAVIGLLAFIMAFTFQIAANHYDARKTLLLEEVTQIRKVYLQAGLIPEPLRSNTRILLKEYVDLRIHLAADPSKLAEGMARSQQILDTLWKYAENLAAQDRSSEAYSLYTASVNELVDKYNQRVTMGLEIRIPVLILVILMIITFFSMLTLGYHFGISGKGNFNINLMLAIVFATVIFLIISLDRPEFGISIVNQKPMVTLQKQLQKMQDQ
ncbi:MAG TPA: hypothetical protein VMC08_00660 [Bacteroidales bacterium]|nr:hypothetical protein [Bacteroidales bacterium]